MDKNTLTRILQKWMKDFLKNNTNSFEVMDVIIPKSNLSKLSNGFIKSLPNYSSWDFKPDVLAILAHKETGDIRLALVNRSTSALSLKEIGEINIYAKLVDAEFAFLVSTNGISSEVNLLLLEEKIQKRLLNYSDGKKIIIFSWNEKENGIDAKSIVPFEAREFILG